MTAATSDDRMSPSLFLRLSSDFHHEDLWHTQTQLNFGGANMPAATLRRGDPTGSGVVPQAPSPQGRILRARGMASWQTPAALSLTIATPVAVFSPPPSYSPHSLTLINFLHPGPHPGVSSWRNPNEVTFECLPYDHPDSGYIRIQTPISRLLGHVFFLPCQKNDTGAFLKPVLFQQIAILKLLT